MAAPTQKKIKELLGEFSAEQKRLNELNAKREEAIRPAKEQYEKTVAEKDTKFSAKIEASRVRVVELQQEIELEMKKGYNLKEDSYSLTKVETEEAFVEINTREQRDVSTEEWLEAVPKSEQKGTFWETLKVQIQKAEKFRSDLVEKLATKKRSHSFTIRVK